MPNFELRYGKKEYSEEGPCKNVLDEMSFRFGPRKNVLHIKCPPYIKSLRNGPPKNVPRILSL
jgi:hypothetical protein